MRKTDIRRQPEASLSTGSINSARLAPSVFASVTVCLSLILFAAFFGSDDLEESANTAYSAGAQYSPSSSVDAPNGIHSVWGVPVFDTLQGTGDRLPYQGSWGQSIFWPLRLIVSWEYHYLLRTLLFAVPAVLLCLRTLLSWVPKARFLTQLAFGFLVNSSFGLYVRQNEWSDHYVQTISTVAISMFLLHRDFCKSEVRSGFDSPKTLLLCVLIAGNGVITGHPGFWPISFFMLVATAVVLAPSKTFREQIFRWISQMWKQIFWVGAVSLLTVMVVAHDLVSEIAAEFGRGRLARTQGLFGGYAFGVYSEARLGLLPKPLAHFASTLLSTVLMPFFMIFDRLLPQMFRASSFRELARVEFSALLGIFAAMFAWRKLKDNSLRSLIVRVAVLQMAVWVFIFASSRDLLPTVVAASGAWMAVPIILALNIFVTFALLANCKARRSMSWVLGWTNLIFAAFWFLFQINVASFGPSIHLPEKFSSHLRVADAISQSVELGDSGNPPGRTVIANAPFYNFLNFVALGVPVVSPANQKIRDSRHLEDDYALNFAVETPTIRSQADLDRLGTRLNFLNVESVILGYPGDRRFEGKISDTSAQVRLPMSEEVERSLPSQLLRGVEVLPRDYFPAFVLNEKHVVGIEHCPIMHSECPLLDLSSQVAPSASPRLQLCRRDCLWTYDTPFIDDTKILILPITFDSSLRVLDDEEMLKTLNVGGFLGTYSERGVSATTLTIELEPDLRMKVRVAASYVNLMLPIVITVLAAYQYLIAGYRSGARSRQSKWEE